MTEGDRASRLKPAENFEEPSQQEIAAAEAANTVRQYDLMVKLAEEALADRENFRFRISTINKLNRVAVEGMVPNPGAPRAADIEIIGSGHEPPGWRDVPELLEQLCEYVNDNWSAKTPLHLSAYVMWRINWIHPFADGNGRTSRAVSYFILCVALGYVLPGEVTIPEQIAASKIRYYKALEAADASVEKGNPDVSQMETLLHDYLEAQLKQLLTKAVGEVVERPEPPGPAWDMDY